MSAVTDTGAGTPAVPTSGPVILDGLPAEAYHDDRASVSSSGARRLLAPSCPALYRWEQDHPQSHRRTFDLGHAAHKLVLDDGPRIVLVDHDDYRTKAARADRDAVYAAGNIPLLPLEYEQVHAMAAAIRQHPVAGRLFQPGTGRAEVSLFWDDPRTGVRRRARPDWLPHPAPGRRQIVVDYKTTRSAAPDAIQRAVYEYGYHQQAAWYLSGVKALGLAGEAEPGFVFVFQEKAAPYLVTVVELDHTALTLGAARNAAALDLYRECTATGHWPGYRDGIAYLPLPAWAEKRDHEEYL